MPKLSKMGSSTPASPIRKLAPYADQAKREGVKIYHLNIGQPDIETPEVALEALRSYPNRILAYGSSLGELSYREKLVGYYASVGIELTAEQIMVTAGGSEAIEFAFRACMDAGDEVLIPEPFYANYNTFAHNTEVVVCPIRSSIESGFALPSIAQFEQGITPRTRAILICNPNNPTGYLYSLSELEQLRDLVLKHNLYLICDEVYREFCYDGATHHSALSLEGIEQNVIMIDSVSKRYSMCGVRVGALVSRNREVMEAVLRMGQARLCPSVIGQMLAEAALDTPASYFEQVESEYTRRRDCLVGALREIPGVISPNPQGAFYVVIRLPVHDSEHFAQWLLEEFRFQGATVMVAPASGFYATEGLGQDEVRLAYVLKCEDLLAAVRCLKEALAVYPDRK